MLNVGNIADDHYSFRSEIMKYDLICIGAGPTGLACAIEAKRAGMRPLVIDKGTLCNSLYHYPLNMLFFTAPELLEIGDLPLVCAGEKPTRLEALKYYRKCAEHNELEVRLGERVTDVEGRDGNFQVRTVVVKSETTAKYSSRKLVVATGYYDSPNRLNVPGEDLPHVSHYYTDPHPYWRQDVIVIGGRNSAAEAALDLYRNGAHVVLVHRSGELGTTKYWVRPDIDNRIKAGQIKALFRTRVVRIEPGMVHVIGPDGANKLRGSQVFALTGYHPDFGFLRELGIKLDWKTNKPRLNPTTLESNIPGVYLAGVVIGGNHTSEIFIENGRFHGKQIIAALTGSPLALAPR
jgi:thioredoxin reductase (NADPH)